MCVPRRIQVSMNKHYSHQAQVTRDHHVEHMSHSHCVFVCVCVCVCARSGLFCEFSPPMVLPRTSPCDHYDCANGAQCVVKDTDPVCQCLHGYEGVHCERLVSVNFINRESFLQIPSNLITEQANISLQVHVIKRSFYLCFFCVCF